jgi:hypothetical protein
MLFSIDDIHVCFDDIGITIEYAELGAWGECKALLFKTYFRFEL